tara:strand:+ start:8560 stop:8724 length:165 start_codon:yes stop_codon:yes gene_type:complete
MIAFSKKEIKEIHEKESEALRSISNCINILEENKKIIESLLIQAEQLNKEIKKI